MPPAEVVSDGSIRQNLIHSVCFESRWGGRKRWFFFYSVGDLYLCRMGVDTSLQENVVAAACVVLVVAFIVFLLVVARSVIVKWPRLTEEELLEVESINRRMDVWSVQQAESCSLDIEHPETDGFVQH